MANAEYLSGRESGGEVVGIQAPAFQQALDGPESQLAVVRRKPHTTAVRVEIRQVVGDLAMA